METLTRKRVLFFFKTVISITLLAWVLTLADQGRLRETLAQLGAADVSLAIGAIFFGYIIAFIRWLILLRCVAVRVPFYSLIPDFMLSAFYNHVLPSSVGGDAVRAYYLHQKGYDLHAVVASTLMDRLLGLTTMVLLAAVTWIWVGDRYGVSGMGLFVPVVALFFGCVLIAWIVIRLGGPIKSALSSFGTARMRSILSRLMDTLDCYRDARLHLALAFLLSVMSQAALVISYVVFSWALEITVPWWTYFFIIPGVMLMQIAPISFAGLGVREAGLVGLLVALDVDVNLAVALSLAYLAALWISVLPGGLVALWYLFRHPKNPLLRERENVGESH